MALAAQPSKITADEFFALPDDELLSRTQLIDGELVVTTPNARHQRIIFWLAHLHLRFSEDHPGAGELGAVIDTPIDEHNVFIPDLWWMPAERRLASHESRFGTPPPLVVEVRSPSTWRFDVGTKLRHYEKAGVAEVWLIDTAADAVMVFRRSRVDSAEFDVSLELGRGDELATPLIPGWTIDLAELFDR